MTIHHDSSTRDSWFEHLLDGTPVQIRPIRPEDAALEREFITGLSMESRYGRFLEGVKQPSPELIEKLTEIDRQRDAAFIALAGSDSDLKQIGASRYYRCGDSDDAECAVVVADAYQHKGLGTLLMRHLIEHARSNGIDQLFSIDSATNRPMGNFAAHLGFRHETDPSDTTLVIHRLDLNPQRPHR